MVCSNFSVLYNIPDISERFRRYRNFLHSVMSATAANKYESIQIIEAKRMLDSLISAPMRYDYWLDRFSSSLTTRLIWGKRVETGEEEFFRTLHDITNTFEQVSSRGSQLYKRFPSLLLLPDWIAPLKRTARRLHMWEANFFRRLVNETRLDMAAGTAQPSFARHFIENKAATGLSETEGAYVLGGVFEAGAEMTAAQMKSFCLALCLYPEWQDKMQTEIDAVCGQRMPEFADIPSLPVTRAILVEVARWRPACPGGTSPFPKCD
jgi:cytochrome P450